MTRKSLFMAATMLTLASAPTFAASGPATSPPLLDPLWSARYTIPDTEIDVMLVDRPDHTPGGHMVLVPNWIDGAPGVKLDIPMRLLAITLGQLP